MGSEVELVPSDKSVTVTRAGADGFNAFFLLDPNFRERVAICRFAVQARVIINLENLVSTQWHDGLHLRV